VRDTDRPDGTAASDSRPPPPDGSDATATTESTKTLEADGRARSDESAGSVNGQAGSDGAAGPTAQPAETAKPAETAQSAETARPARPGARLKVPALLSRAAASVGSLAGPLARRREASAAGGRPRPGEAAGAALARLTVLPAVLIVAWLLPGLPLLLGSSFLPVPMLLISVPLAVALAVNGLRVVPASGPRPSAREQPAQRGWISWFGLLGTVAVVAGLIAWQLRESSQSIIVVRDAGTYLQAAYWIAQHGLLAIPKQLAAFGGPHAGLTFTSTGFLSRGGSLYPAVTAGMPMLLAAGFWAHASAGAAAVGPILGGLAALSFAGLVARLVGPQWAPAGALVLGFSLPQQYVSRSTLSETALEVLLFGGLCLLADSLILRWSQAPARAQSTTAEASQAGTPTTDTAVLDVAVPPDAGRRRLLGSRQQWRRLATPAEWAAWLTPPRALAGLAGLAMGLSLLVSLDAALYLLPVIPFAAVLMVGRLPSGSSFLAGLVVGAIYGIAGAFLLGRSFVDTVGVTSAIAGVAAVWLVALSVLAAQAARLPSVRRLVPRLLAKIPLRWLPALGALVTAAALIGFAVRPYVQIVHGHPSPFVSNFIAGLQRLQGLPVDPTRLYSEQTLYWTIWYIGLPTVLLGGFGLVLLVYRCLRALLTWRDPERSWRIWGLPVAIICAGSATILWQPDIVPDQPWASRRLVVMVLPGLIIAALWAASWLSIRARSRGAKPATAVVVGVFCAAAMLVPTVATTFGLGFSHGGKAGGLRPVAQGLALHRIGPGQVQAVATLCAQIPSKASVIIVDASTAAHFAQVIRGMCGVPVAAMIGQPVSATDSVASAISAAGRRPVLLASSPRRLASFGGSAVRIMDLVTTGDPHELTQPPTAPPNVKYVIWMTSPGGAGAGA
jgi:hypothetical protein